jgi:hypothetical protein
LAEKPGKRTAIVDLLVLPETSLAHGHAKQQKQKQKVLDTNVPV